MKGIAPYCLILIGLLIVTCSNPIKNITDQFNSPPEVASVTRAIKTSLPLAYAANCALDAVCHRVGPGVTVARSSDSFPCNAIVTILVSKQHPLPVGGDSSGTVVVSGLFSDSSGGVITVFFTNTNVKDGSFTLKNAAFVPVSRDTTSTLIVFAAEDVNADSQMVVNTKITDSMVTVKFAGLPLTIPSDSAACVNQKAWITVVHEDSGYALGAEKYEMVGASQYLGVNPSTVEIIMAVMVQVKLNPLTCRKNPWSGFAMIRHTKIQDNSNLLLGTVILSFNSACNGTASIPIATGTYLGSIGSTVALNLDP